ncbi:unnamed protein product [Moneuplotes crassus]|uniref:Uncharacterized protein n=1 Tax=Euplotes crassus TaxID=5936 RepID=A0AAD1XPJ2_EUPCR|nr:unnamed protein product [Moneuplotes crassus]
MPDIDEELSPNPLKESNWDLEGKQNNLVYDKGFVKDKSSFKQELLDIFEKKKTSTSKVEILSNKIPSKSIKPSKKNRREALKKLSKFYSLKTPCRAIMNKEPSFHFDEDSKRSVHNNDNREWTRKISSSKILEVLSKPN